MIMMIMMMMVMVMMITMTMMMIPPSTSWSAHLDVSLHVLNLAPVLTFTFRLLKLLKLRQLLYQLRVRPLHLPQIYNRHHRNHH